MVSGMLGFMTVTGYAGMTNIKGIIPVLLPPDELFAGSPGRFKVLLRNEKKRIPSFLLQLEASDYGKVLVPLIGGGQQIETTLNLTFPERGRHPVGQIRVSSPFPVNFFTRYWSFKLATPCIVYPRLAPFSSAMASEHSRQAGTNVHHGRGQDGELERIREYSGAEPLRSIHWKLSARGDELLVKEFGNQSVPPLVIRFDGLPGAGVEEKLSHAAWLIKQRVMEQPVGLDLDGQIIQPATGRQHGTRLLTELALYGQQ